MKLADLGQDAAQIRFGDLKRRYARDYVALRAHAEPIFADIGPAPGAWAKLNFDSGPYTIGTPNVLEWDFTAERDDIAIEMIQPASEEVNDIIWSEFPIAALWSDPPFSVGFLQEVQLRSNLYRLDHVQHLLDVEEKPLIRLSQGLTIWNVQWLQSLTVDPPPEWGTRYRFVTAFMHPSYGFLDFNGIVAASLMPSWAGRALPIHEKIEFERVEGGGCYC
jgi:hypothetical protein